MKKCELCNSPAKLFCESDQATLCWVCDAKVHSANFLVTKHSRILLCHLCQSLTPWHGSGPKFVPTMSVCNDCVSNNREGFKQHSDEDHDDDGDDEDEDEDEDEDGNNDDDGGDGGAEEEEGGDNDDEEEEEEENQVVPWKSTPPPPVSSSSNSSNFSSRFSD